MKTHAATAEVPRPSWRSRRGARETPIWAGLAVVAAAAGMICTGSRVAGQQPVRPAPQVPSFRAGVDLVSLAVTIIDPSGRYVTDLGAGDFSVYEDGVKQDVTFFNRSNVPVALALLLDTSASMEDKIAIAQEAAIGFARRLRPEDLAEIISFDSRFAVLQGFTSKPDELEVAIRKTTAGGSTSLYNAVYVALMDMKKIRARQADEIRRQAIVLLSDGEDTSSLVTFDQLLDVAKRSETAVYAIGLRSKEGEPGGKGFKEAEFVLRELTSETGGRVFFTPKIEELPSVYAQISDELSSQYLVGYSSRNPRRDGAWRRVVVRVDRPNLNARTKQGYYGPTAR
jgi:Ca-activated chloride channel family protein